MTELQLLVLTGAELFHRSPVRRGRTRAPGKPISSSMQLSPGDLVVHLSHGIGLYRGLQHIEKNGERVLNAKMLEAPIPARTLSINKINERVQIMVADDKSEGRCIVTSDEHVELEPQGSTRVNLGVSITLACGTIATLAPTGDSHRRLWGLYDFRIEIGSNNNTTIKYCHRKNTCLKNRSWNYH